MIAAQLLSRQEVIKKDLKQRNGQIHLSQAKYTVVLLCAVLAIPIHMAVYVVFGFYTKQTTVSDATSPDQGLLKIVPRSPGTIAAIRTVDGQTVKKEQLPQTIVADEKCASAPKNPALRNF
ncbi:hypothetical protein [Variovorax sp.]|uniref:hypothetical protein n=1 Tax=Variovorax sp. TaxID=1871043 RepID=UPI0037D9E85D